MGWIARFTVQSAGGGSGLVRSEWKKRLVLAIRQEVARGRTLKEISQTAGLGPNFVQQLINSDKVPSVDALIALCGSLKITAAGLFPEAPEPQATEIMDLASKLRPEDFRVVLELARYLASRNS